MSAITREDADELRTYLDEHVPDWEVVWKDRDDRWWPGVLPKVIQIFLAFIGLFSEEAERNFKENYAQGVGKWLLLPSKEEHGDWTEPGTYAVVRHEAVHMRDWKNRPIWWPFSWLLMLPTVFTMRSVWEMRGYAQNMIVEYELKGEVSEGTIDAIAEQFTSSTYLWMRPSFLGTRKRIAEIADAIEREDVSGFYPRLP